jgi:YCII-related domain
MEDDREAPLARLRTDVSPPGELKERVLASVQSLGLVHHPHRSRPWWAIAAGLALFIGGLALGRWATAPNHEGQRYALLLYDPVTFDRSIPDSAVVSEYRSWAVSLGDRLSVGEKLGTAQLVLQPGDSANRPAPGEGEAGPLGGLFIVRAGTWDEAMAIARTCPHLKHGGIIAVRAIEET